MPGDMPEGRELLTEDQGYALLEEFGIPVPRYMVATNLEEAMRGADRVGYPVVLKVVSPDVIHKSDVGGVAVHITGQEALKEAMTRMKAELARKVPSARIAGFLVEQEMPPGLELYIGGKTDQAFGKVISFGLGGTAIEVFRDIALRVLPLGSDGIRSMIRQIRGYPLITGHRGSPPLDEEALEKTIESAIRLFLSDEGVAEFDINPVVLYPRGVCAVDARIYREPASPVRTAARAEVDPGLFHPSAIAVIGASSDPKKIGYSVFANLLPFPGPLYPVNPGRAEILGRKAYARVSDIPGPVDTAVIAVPALAVEGVMEELAARKARLAIIISSGFSETGRDGREREERLLAIARAAGIRVIGPNCLGIVLPHENINTTFDPVAPLKGNIAFISQSGSVITTIVDWSVPEEIGFSAVISVGNQLDLDFIDFLKYAGSDPGTQAIILYIEEIKDGRAFLDAVAEITKTKPVIVLKSGSSAIGRRAAASHTGALAGDFEVYLSAFRQAGATPVFSILETFDLAKLVVWQGYPVGKRTVVISAAGGFAVLASDYAERYRVGLPALSPGLMEELDRFLPPIWNRANPMDIIGDGGAERYARVFDTLLRFPDEWDIAVVIAVPSAVINSVDLAWEMVRFSQSTKKITIGCFIGGDSMKEGVGILRSHHIPNYDDIDSAFRALGRSIAGHDHR